MRLLSLLIIPCIVLLLVTIIDNDCLLFQNCNTKLLDKIAITGDLNQAQQQELLALIRKQKLRVNNFKKLKTHLEAIPWIATAAIERQWQEGVVAVIVPEKAIAHWNESAYVNSSGSVFTSHINHRVRLPQLYGPMGEERKVMVQFQQLNNILLKVGQSIDLLQLSDHGDWDFTTNEGIKVKLGKTDLLERLQRLLTIVRYLAQSGVLADVDGLDTRYENGVAVTWKRNSEITNLVQTYNS